MRGEDEYRPTLGAVCAGGGTRFRVWAPRRRRVEVVVETGPAAGEHALAKDPDGFFSGEVGGVGVGDRYRYRLDGEGPFPDPASRFQPDGVHGPSEVVDPYRFGWSDAGWRGVELAHSVVYELHVGTFDERGSFEGVTRRLPHLRDLGVTALELMPLADFAGRRGWGYDGVDLFAPARCYGRPAPRGRLAPAAHRLGLDVILDVVYNHLGPDGAYLGTFSPDYFSKRHRTPWGPAVNLDGPHSGPARDFFIENALHWVHEYHVDGLRLDATHALVDDGPRHFLAELSSRVRASIGASRTVLLIAEDHRNLAALARPEEEGGCGLDAVWADDFHHQVRRGLAGDHEGYFRDFTGSAADLAATLRRGWFYCGQHSENFGAPRGTPPETLSPPQFVICVQNHDQVGNRAFGDRLHHGIDLAAYRAASALLLCAPQTPLLFMGQEWAATTPFLYFTDHHRQLGRLVTRGRRHEFAAFSAFSDPAVRARIPDPQAADTFERSRLRWEETARPPHDAILRLYRDLLRLRAEDPALRQDGRDAFEAVPSGADQLLLLRRGGGRSILTIVRLRGEGAAEGSSALPETSERRWERVLDTESPRYCSDPCPPRIELGGAAPTVHFARPGAVLLKSRS
jgi:maltooligosyltrehalose trehalohydrolase